MAASPDRIGVVTMNGDDLIVASIVTEEKAQGIAEQYQQQLIQCDSGDDTWTECVKQEHSSQVLLQLWVTCLQTAFYIIALPRTSNASGRIVYTIMGHLSFRYANKFFDQYLNRIGKLLLPIFQKLTICKVVKKLPKQLEPDVLELIQTRWPSTQVNLFEVTQNLDIYMLLKLKFNHGVVYYVMFLPMVDISYDTFFTQTPS